MDTLRHKLTDFSNIKSFVVQNGLIIAIAGITIGTSTKDMLKSFAIDIMMPLVYLIFIESLMKKINPRIYKRLSNIFSGSSTFLWKIFAKELIAWFLVLIVSYVFIVFFLNKIFNTQSENDKKIIEENEKYFYR